MCDKFVSALHSAKAASSLSSLEDGDAESFESSSERFYSDDLDGSDAEICAAMIEEDRLKENEMLAPPLAADRQAAATDSLVRGSGSGKTKLAWVRSLMPAAVAGSKTLQRNRDIRGDTGIRWCGMLNMMWQQVPNFQQIFANLLEVGQSLERRPRTSASKLFWDGCGQSMHTYLKKAAFRMLKVSRVLLKRRWRLARTAPTSCLADGWPVLKRQNL